MKHLAISVMLAMALLPSILLAQSPDATGKETYGLSLPRDMGILSIPDSDYPHWPLRADQMGYADVSGSRMKEWVVKISAISLESQAAGNMYWGRLPGTAYDAMTMKLMTDELQRLGLETVRVPHTIPRDWAPTFWKASYRVGSRSIPLSTAFPAGQTAATPRGGLTAEAVWVGVGSEPDFLGRDVEGKAVIIYSTFVPGRAQSLRKRPGGPVWREHTCFRSRRRDDPQRHGGSRQRPV